MNRYLINLGYIGTPFRGIQKQITTKNTFDEDPSTIQGQMEIAMKIFGAINRINVVVSSRTDAGVHALHTTMHVDLERQNGKPYDPFFITKRLNIYFTKLSIPIRILKTYIVPSNFNCRFAAISRTYLYKLCTIKTPTNDLPLWNYIPITEINRREFISEETFNVDITKEVCNYFVGLHDFRTFMHKSANASGKVTRRVIYNFDFNEVPPPCLYEKSWCNPCDSSNYKYYDFRIKGSGFLHKQVRRMVASLLAVAQGILTPRDIKLMLEIPSANSWKDHIRNAPAHGLYLSEVAYSQQDQQTFLDTIDEDPVQ